MSSRRKTWSMKNEVVTFLFHSVIMTKVRSPRSGMDELGALIGDSGRILRFKMWLQHVSTWILDDAGGFKTSDELT